MTPGKQLFFTYVALLVLLAAAVGASFLPPGPWSGGVSYAIAAAKTLLIAGIFMKLRESPPALRLFALGGVFWLILMFGVTWADYLTRGHAGVPGK